MSLNLDASTGLLPPGIHSASVDEVEACFVDPYPLSATRRAIFDYWLHHRNALAELTEFREQWLDGSFVTAKDEPGDSDVVTHFKPDAVDVLPDHKRLLLISLLSGKYTRAYWGCDSYYLVEYPVGHPHRAAYEAQRDYWERLFARVRNKPGVAKGFVAVSA